MATKRPHFVPRVYLNAWANGQSQVAYRRRDMPQAVVSSTVNVAVAGGIYGAGEISEAREKFFNDLEADWPSLRHQLKMDRNLTGDRRQLMAVYLAIQLARTVHHRNQAQFMIDLAAKTTERPIPADVVREHLRELDGGDDPLVWDGSAGGMLGAVHAFAAGASVVIIQRAGQEFHQTARMFHIPLDLL